MIFQNAYISAEIRRNGQLSSSLERLIETSWRNIASHHCNNVEHLPTGPEENSFVFPRVLMRTLGKTKLTSFPWDHTLSTMLYIQTFP